MDINKFLLALCLTVPLAAVEIRAGEPVKTAGAKGPLTLVVLDPLALQNACDCVKGYAQRDYQALAEFLSQQMGQPVKPVFGASLAAVLKRLEGRQPDLIMGKQSAIEHDSRETRLKITRFAGLTDRKGALTFQGLFIVRSGDPARSLRDLKGKKILLGPAADAEKHGAARAALEKAGIVVKDPQTAEDCTRAAVALVNQEADAAVISDYALPLLEGCKTIAQGELRVIGKTAEVPFIALYVHADMSSVTRSTLAKALTALAENQPMLRKMESAAGFELIRPPAPQGAAPWGDWRGPGRAGLFPSVPCRLPRQPLFLWRKKLASQGLGGVAATDSVVILSDKSGDETRDIWLCLNASDGRTIWELRYPAQGKMDFTNAPRATPVVCGEQVYLLGAFGHLFCVRLADGQVHWKCDLHADYQGKLPTWGFCATPLIVEDRVIVNGGSRGAFLVALDRHTGKLAWKTPGEQIAYGQFLLAEIAGRPQIIGCDYLSMGGWDARTGKRIWALKHPQKSEFSVPTPILVGDKVLFVDENNGARLYTFDRDGIIKPGPVAHNPDLNPQITSPVAIDGKVWVTTGSGLYCADAARKLTVVWKDESGTFPDFVNLLAGNQRVLVLGKDGLLALLPAAPAVGARPELLELFGRGNKVEVWSHPAPVGDRLYLRTDSEIVCLSLDSR